MLAEQFGMTFAQAEEQERPTTGESKDGTERLSFSESNEVRFRATRLLRLYLCTTAK